MAAKAKPNNGDNMNNVTCKTIRNKISEYLRDKINDLEINSRNKNTRVYRGEVCATQ
jgi:ribosomal protein S17E